LKEEEIISREQTIKDFNKMLEPYRHDLKRYCLMTAGTEWDAEDLFQETLIKAFTAFQRLNIKEMNKTYIFRIALNTWIDLCRKKKMTLDTFEEENLPHQYTLSNEFVVREALESLTHQLPAKQVVIVLLMDVFQFTAKETAEMIAATEGAVHTTLHRARKKLQTLAKSVMGENISSHGSGKPLDEEGSKSSSITNSDSHLNNQLFESFVEGFRRRSPEAIISAYRALSHHGVEVESIKRSGTTLYFYLKDPDGNILMIST
jgi:RNA polymerase sigma factor (sigma-70 family)